MQSKTWQFHYCGYINHTLIFHFRWFSNIRERCAKPVINDVLPKLAEYSPGVPTDVKVTVNVVIADFIEMNNALFPRTIIDLNFKLLRNVEMVYHGMKMLDFA